MKTFLFILFVFIIGFFGWFFFVRATPKSAEVMTPVNDTMIIVKDSIINAGAYESTPSGFYQGMLPCRTCDAIQRTILFSGDQFKMEELSLGQGTAAKQTAGEWKKLNGRFLLSVNNKMVAQYILVKDSLINIENNGVRIPDSLSKHNVLFKKKSPTSNLSWDKRRSEGIDIVGSGSDPYWNIEIDNEKLILFKLAAAGKPVIVPIEKPKVTRDSTFYSIVTEAGSELKISISSNFCHDGITDHLYEYKMTVWYKGIMYKGCAVILTD
jgi:uncharacterized membrane protein